jgi:polyhydroxyalkanoate synthesis regulator phasin
MNDFHRMNDQRRERMLRELASNLADLVESGDMTSEQANEWYSDKADQWN